MGGSSVEGWVVPIGAGEGSEGAVVDWLAGSGSGEGSGDMVDEVVVLAVESKGRRKEVPAQRRLGSRLALLFSLLEGM
jgi:hypothetical protein